MGVVPLSPLDQRNICEHIIPPQIKSWTGCEGCKLNPGDDPRNFSLRAVSGGSKHLLVEVSYFGFGSRLSVECKTIAEADIAYIILWTERTLAGGGEGDTPNHKSEICVDLASYNIANLFFFIAAAYAEVGVRRCISSI